MQAAKQFSRMANALAEAGTAYHTSRFIVPIRPKPKGPEGFPMKPICQCRLYTFVDTAYLQGRPPALVAQQLCDGGSDLIQLRAKGETVEEVQRMADKILPITERAGVGLVINDHIGVAVAVGAPVCHLGQEDFFDRGFKHVSGLPTNKTHLLIGLSSHAPDQANRALAAGVDYVAIGPVFRTGTKPSAKPVTLDYVRWAASHLTVPWFAIGGINLGNVTDVIAAGARRVCVVSAILNAPDVAAACQKFKSLLTSDPVAEAK